MLVCTIPQFTLSLQVATSLSVFLDHVLVIWEFVYTSLDRTASVGFMMIMMLKIEKKTALLVSLISFKPFKLRSYTNWREETGLLSDGRHFKIYFLIDESNPGPAEERQVIYAEDGHRKDR